jgi:hypothetical protein
MSKSKSPQYIFVKLRVPGASQSLFSPFFLSVSVELDFEESGIWSDLPSVAVSAGLPSVRVSVSQSVFGCGAAHISRLLASHWTRVIM